MADAMSPQALSDLIGSIYDCSLDPSRWERTLADVAEALEYDAPSDGDDRFQLM